MSDIVTISKLSSKQDQVKYAIKRGVEGLCWKEIAQEMGIGTQALEALRIKYDIDRIVEAQFQASLAANRGELSVAERVRVLVGIATDRAKEASSRVAAIKLITDLLGDSASRSDTVPLTGLDEKKALSIILQLDDTTKPAINVDVPTDIPRATPVTFKSTDPVPVASKPPEPATGLPTISLTFHEAGAQGGDGVEPDKPSAKDKDTDTKDLF